MVNRCGVCIILELFLLAYVLSLIGLVYAFGADNVQVSNAFALQMVSMFVWMSLILSCISCCQASCDC
jgi:hypothetical protein